MVLECSQFALTSIMSVQNRADWSPAAVITELFERYIDGLASYHL